MSKICPITGKRPKRGYQYTIRGIAKKKKGIGLKVTGKTKRTFLPNIKKKRIWIAEEKRFVTLRISTSGLRTLDKLGVTKVVQDLRQKGIKV